MKCEIGFKKVREKVEWANIEKAGRENILNSGNVDKESIKKK